MGKHAALYRGRHDGGVVNGRIATGGRRRAGVEKNPYCGHHGGGNVKPYGICIRQGWNERVEEVLVL
jgi:hypothetical protein